jgi:UDP-2,3-diacylglucosamine hydrolase
MQSSKTLFISDLHLQEDNADSRRNFFDFLNNIAPSSEALYILGDFFEAYIGDDHQTEFIQSISNALKNLYEKHQTKIYLMRGNRDFLMGDDFAKQCSAILLPDPVVIDLYGVKTLLTHGDIFCSEDKSYQVYRKFIQSRFVRFLLLSSPLSFRQKLAGFLRNKSKQHVYHAPKIMMDVSSFAVQKAANHTKAAQIIHGHTHRPDVHQENTFMRYVLPDWHPKGGMLSVICGSSPELIRWD